MSTVIFFEGCNQK